MAEANIIGPGLRLGIDIGGTFTDFALVDRTGRRIGVHKQLTTPLDPSSAVLEGTAAICAAAGCAPADLVEVVHGTTLVTNALIERRGDRTGMLVTAGFRDLLDIGREQRYDLFDLRIRFAEPLVERALRAEVPERLKHDGSVLVPLDEAAVAAGITRLVEEERIEALAICFLHAHADDRHERRARAIALDLYPGLYVSHSADVFPYPREFERWTTTTANAYSQPLVDRYLSRLEGGLAEAGFRGRLWIMASSGGLMSLAMARRHPVRLLESGPAAGVMIAARIGRERTGTNLLSFDLGGTTAKGALVRDGRPFRTYSFEAAHAYEYRSGSGLQLQIPVLDMTEIGTGGGSLVGLDELGRLRVGPRSAGAEPGPVCYGRGGRVPTLTDANLVLGYLHPDSFLGGSMRLDIEGARAAFEAEIGAALGVDALRAAWGVHDVANEDIARAFRMHATERGFDYRGSAMVAFGGGGPLHAARIARKLRVPRVIFPMGAGVMSAFGMLSGAQAFEAVRAFPRRLDDVSDEELAATLAELEAEASSPLVGSGVPAPAIRWHRRADMRYSGQHYDIEVEVPERRGPAPDGGLREALRALFSARYREIFHTNLDQPIAIVGWKVEAGGPAPGHVTTGPTREGTGGDALIGRRPAFFPLAGGLVDCPVYARGRLAPGTVVAGPALIEEAESTTLLDAGDRAEVGRDLTLMAEIGGA
ncbi:hydantoinase/oxoprolinase family protein [uncultured Enterovirga sp.]|uniref:hydantoinase/oxoprolinase family protein n=1 Tax=uncultured Enterovirga sp. TaxID=2026352 RepID=UPI0035C9755C